MENEDEKNLMVNVRLMRITGLYQLLMSREPKPYGGLNAFGWMAVAETVWLIMAMCALIPTMVYCMYDENKSAQYVILFVACAMTVFKLYRVMRYRDTIWTCVQTTRMDRLSYGRHRSRVLELGRAKSISMSSVVSTLRFTLLVIWILLPFILWGQFIEVKYDGGRVFLYRINVLNYVFAVDSVSINKYFAVSYLAESITMTVWSHAELTFDVLLISLCIAGSYQLKTVADSFANLGAACRRPKLSEL